MGQAWVYRLSVPGKDGQYISSTITFDGLSEELAKEITEAFDSKISTELVARQKEIIG